MEQTEIHRPMDIDRVLFWIQMDIDLDIFHFFGVVSESPKTGSRAPEELY